MTHVQLDYEVLKYFQHELQNAGRSVDRGTRKIVN